jgi:hypothetical protein
MLESKQHSCFVSITAPDMHIQAVQDNFEGTCHEKHLDAIAAIRFDERLGSPGSGVQAV